MLVMGGRWAVGGGRWAVGGGRCAVGGGRCAVGGGRWAVGGGRCAVRGGRWAAVRGPTPTLPQPSRLVSARMHAAQRPFAHFVDLEEWAVIREKCIAVRQVAWRQNERASGLGLGAGLWLGLGGRAAGEWPDHSRGEKLTEQLQVDRVDVVGGGGTADHTPCLCRSSSTGRSGSEARWL